MNTTDYKSMILKVRRKPNDTPASIAIKRMTYLIVYHIFCDEIETVDSTSLAGHTKYRYRMPSKERVSMEYIRWAECHPGTKEFPTLKIPTVPMVKLALKNAEERQIKRKVRDLRNMKIGSLFVVRPTGFKNKSNQIMWICDCACGNTVAKPMMQLTQHKLRSCGHKCPYRPKPVRKTKGRTSEYMKQKYGAEFKFWNSMINRCMNKTNKMYPRYGALGIGVEPAWVRSFDTFMADMGPAPDKRYPKLLRFDADDDYVKYNVTWRVPDMPWNPVNETVDYEWLSNTTQAAQERKERFMQERDENKLREELENKIRRAQL